MTDESTVFIQRGPRHAGANALSIAVRRLRYAKRADHHLAPSSRHQTRVDEPFPRYSAALMLGGIP
jgi:hypothetical protein